jgi:hypothetical protein
MVPRGHGGHIALTIGTDPKAAQLPMKKLIADGKVSTKGERRGMAYLSN